MIRSAPVDHFANLVPWSELTSPLRPAPADVAIVQNVIDEQKPRRVLLLGLTPELAGARWPHGTELLAVDHSPDMISRLWPPPGAPAGARVIMADWCDMPLASGSIELALGDGCLALLTFDGWSRLAREVSRVLAPAGRLALRVFLRPEVPETVEAIGAELARGEIRNINALKLRLFAAVHAEGARLDDVWRAWSTMRREPGPGFTPESLAGVERYRGSDARYFLGTRAELRALFAPHLSDVAWVTPSGYELAERCPTVLFRSSEQGDLAGSAG